MAQPFETKTTVDLDALTRMIGERVANLLPTMQSAGLATVTMLASKTIVQALSANPDSGPTKYLHYRTGNLRRSTQDSPTAKIEGQQVTAQYGTNVWYGELLEFGGDKTVPQHTRTSKLGKIFTVRPYTQHVRARHMYSDVWQVEMPDALDQRVRRAIAYLANTGQVPTWGSLL